MDKAEFKDFDHLTSFLGDYGFFQVLMIVLLSLSAIPCGYMGMIVVFISDTPDYHCKISINSTDNNSWIGPGRCSRYKVNRNWAETLSNETEPCLDGWDFSNETYTNTIVTEWGLVCENAWKVPFSTSLFFVGFLIGSSLHGHLSDRFGRKPVFYFTLVLQGITALVQASSVSWLMFCILNCLRGLGQNYAVSLILGSEMLTKTARVTFTVLGHSIGYGIGYALLPLFAYFIRSWRMLLVASAIPSLLFIPTWWVIPESPRWLLHKGRVEEAELVIRNAAKRNKVPAPGVIFCPDELSMLMQNTDEEKRKYNYVDLIRTPNMRNTMILCILIWLAISVVFYGLSLNTSNLNGNVYLNSFISAAIEIAAYLVTWLLVNRFPRPPLLFCTLIFCGIMLLVIKVVPEDIPFMLQVLALAGKIGIAGAFSIIFVFFTELIPTVVRNMGLGASSTAGLLGTIICPYIIYVGVYIKILPFIIFGTISMVAASLSMLLPDTRNCKLPDLISETRPIRGCFCTKERATQDGEA